MYDKKLGTTLLTLTLALASFGSQAGVIYQWVCDDPTCNGDPTFTSTMEISDSAFAAGSFTGVAGNILSWDTTSGVGDGFMVDLADMDSVPGGFNDDVNNIMIVLSADGSQILDLIDIHVDGIFISFREAQGDVFFREGTSGSYFVERTDRQPTLVIASTPVLGIFVRVTQVPEPGTLGLLAAGLLGLAFRRKKAA